MSRRANRLFAALLAGLLLAAWIGPVFAATDRELLDRAEKARAALGKDGKAQTMRHNWLNLIEMYQKVVDQRPGGETARTALMTMGDLYVELYRRSRLSADLDQAVERYRLLTRNFSQDECAAEAQFKIGVIYYEFRKDPDRAYVELLKVELNHPQSPTVRESRTWMAKIAGPAAGTIASSRTAEQPAPAEPEPAKPESPGLSGVTGVRHWANPTYSRVAIDLSGPATFKDHLLRPDPNLNKPMRIYVDITPARIGKGVNEEIPIADGLLSTARLAQHDSDTVRVVLDIQNIHNYRIFSLTDPFRIVVDVSGDQEKTASAKPTAMQSPQAASPAPVQAEPSQPLNDLRDTASKRPKTPRGPATQPPDPNSLARQLGLGVHRVVLDAGHGGKDNGATGVGGVKEKDLVLSFTLKLAKRIESELGMEVVLTRSKDEFIPLEERTAIANTRAADLFISIHANAHKDPKLHGIETYFLNLATDDEAMRVAAVENATTQKNMGDLQVILNDLMLNSKISESSRLASHIHKAMIGQAKAGYKNIRDLGVKQAPFYVLIGANMPSVLLELGFITNKTETDRLRNQAYQERLLKGVLAGIKAYAESVRGGPKP